MPLSHRSFSIAIAFASAVLIASFPTGLQAQDQRRPDGWDVRFDSPEATEDQLEAFTVMTPGWHVTSGPAAIYAPPEEASGNYRLEMEVFLFDPGRRREAFGIFFGGMDLMGDGVEYSYFLIRNGGEFIVKRREGPEAPTLLPWTANDAILAWDDRDEGGASVKNVLVVEAGSDNVRFMVNDVEVASLPRSEVPADGRFGFRVNHGLNLHISRLEMTELEAHPVMRPAL